MVDLVLFFIKYVLVMWCFIILFFKIIMFVFLVFIVMVLIFLIFLMIFIFNCFGDVLNVWKYSIFFKFLFVSVG